MQNTYVEPADPLNVIEQINAISEENDFQEICVICQDILDNGETDFYTLPECNHCYHTNCIITWFRAGHNNCPCCGNQGVNSKKNSVSNPHVFRRSLYFWDKLYKSDPQFKLKRDLYKSDNCPAKLISIFKKYDTLIEELEQLQNENKIGKEERNNLPYKEALEKIRDLRNKIWMKKKSIRIQTKNIMDYPIIPLIIPKKKTV